MQNAKILSIARFFIAFVSFFKQTFDSFWNVACPTGSCAVDVRLINATLGVWCVTTGPCPPGFVNTSQAVPLYNPSVEQLDKVIGASAEVLLSMKLH